MLAGERRRDTLPPVVAREVSPEGIALHRRYLDERLLIDPFVSDMLADGELRILERYGFWMAALAAGTLAPSAHHRRDS
jgi:hypothetical protein